MFIAISSHQGLKRCVNPRRRSRPGTPRPALPSRGDGSFPIVATHDWDHARVLLNTYRRNDSKPRPGTPGGVVWENEVLDLIEKYQFECQDHWWNRSNTASRLMKCYADYQKNRNHPKRTPVSMKSAKKPSPYTLSLCLGHPPFTLGQREWEEEMPPLTPATSIPALASLGRAAIPIEILFEEMQIDSTGESPTFGLSNSGTRASGF